MTPPDTAADGPDGPVSRWLHVAVMVAAAVVLPMVMVVLVVVGSPELSVFDEAAHVDYLRRIEQGEVPRVGDRLLDVTLGVQPCSSAADQGEGRCPSPDFDSEGLLADGYQYEAQQPPTYYVVTTVLRQVTRIGPADSFLVSARLTGAIWLSAGLLVFALACRRLGCRFWPTVLVTTLLAIGPGVVYQSATVNNDAAAIFSGSTALLLFVSLRGRLVPRTVVAWSSVAALLVLIKPTGILAVAAACGALLLDAGIERRLTARRALAFAMPVVVGLIVYLSWSVVHKTRATVDYEIVLEALLGFKQTDELPLADVSANVTRLLGAYGSPGLPISPSFVAGPANLLMLVLMAAGVASSWLSRGGAAAQRVGGVALAALVVGGPAFTMLFYLDYSVGGGPAARYGLSLLPLLAAAAAFTYRTRRAMVMLAVLGALVLVPLFIAITYPTTR